MQLATTLEFEAVLHFPPPCTSTTNQRTAGLSRKSCHSYFVGGMRPIYDRGHQEPVHRGYRNQLSAVGREAGTSPTESASAEGLSDAAGELEKATGEVEHVGAPDVNAVDTADAANAANAADGADGAGTRGRKIDYGASFCATAIV